jgi:uncharacterized repeat protein (TIGR01451 family)
MAVVGALTAGLTLCSASLALADAPAWTAGSSHLPTFFTPGDLHDYYTLTVTNSGSAASDGSLVTVTDTLPSGASATSMEGTEWVCPTRTQLVEGVTPACTRSDVLAAGASYPPIRLHVDVAATAPLGTASNAVVVSGGGAAGSAGDPTTITTSPPFGVSSFATGVSSSQAGAHADVSTTVWFDTYQDPYLNDLLCHGESACEPGELQYPTGYFVPGGAGPADVVLKLPAGLVGNPTAIPLCPRMTFLESVGGTPRCPVDTQVGYGEFYVNSLLLENGGGGSVYPGYRGQLGAIYDLEPTAGEPARLGIMIPTPVGPTLVQVTLSASAADGYAVTATTDDVTNDFQAQHVYVDGFTLTLWGVPADPSNDQHRGACLTINTGYPQGSSCASDQPRVPFMENPTDCTAAPITTMLTDSYDEPGNFLTYASQASGPSGQPVAAGTGCELVPFDPSLEVQPDNARAGAPAGLSVDLKVPQSSEPEAIGTSELRKAVVTLPAGMSISPSAAAQPLGACTDAQFGAGSDVPAQCPADSAIGTTEVITPLLSGPLTGKVYLGQPLEQTDPTSGQMYRVFQEIQGFGLDVKVEGQIAADPLTGQLTATFEGLPELPFGEFKLRFRGGANAVLSNPQGCGTYTTTSQLTPYSGNPPATPSSPFTTSADGSGAPCPASQPFGPGVSVWGSSGQAGASSTVSVSVTRPDGHGYLSSIAAHLPPGLLGNVASVPLCPAANVSAGTCPASSRIGGVEATAGPGSDPLQLPGTVYLGQGFGPYPFSLSVVVPAVAGPYDLGNVKVRVGIQVNNDGSISVQSDPLPTILDGIPIQLRGATVTLDRPGFMFNPTSCAPQSLTSTLTSLTGALASPSAPFQVGGCGYLPFKPTFTVATQASTSKAKGASLTVRVAQKPGEANIHRVDVQLPKALPTRLTTLQKACTEAQFAANPAGCPEGSDVGTATAVTPILNVPLTGPAYLVSHGGAAFPELVTVLQGQGVTIYLRGETDIKKGITYSKFETVPDAPISSFQLNLPEGSHSILGAYLPANAKGSMCGQTLAMPTSIEGQNGSKLTQTTRIAVSGCTAAKTAKVKITGHKVTGDAAMVTVQAPAAGKLTLSGTGLGSVSRTVKKAGKVTLKVKLSKTGVSSLGKHHQKLKVKLKAAFKPGKGSSSSATTTLTFR